MLFHTPKLSAEIRISHLNARINEQRKKIAQTTGSKLELLQLSQQLSKEARARKKTNQKIYVLDFKGCLLYTSPSPRDRQKSRMPSSA